MRHKTVLVKVAELVRGSSMSSQQSIRPRAKQWTPKDEVEAVHLFTSGHPMNEIADRLDGSVYKVREVLRRQGVDTNRPQASATVRSEVARLYVQGQSCQ